jgi:colicin import membrane protein
MDNEVQKQSTSIVEFRPFEAQLEEFVERYEGVVYDLEDPRQDKQARSDRLAIGKVVSRLDAAHRTLKAPLKERVDLIDGERKRIKDRLLEVQDGIKRQIKAREDAIRAHEEALQARVDDIADLAEFDPLAPPPSSEQVAERLEAARAIDPTDESVYETRTADAALEHRRVTNQLEKLLVERTQYEEDQAELARLKAEREEREQQERDARIAAEAAERAKREAEERHQREVEAARKREEDMAREKAEAEERARLAVERTDRQRKEAEEQLERERIEAAARAKREAEEAVRLERERAEQEKAERDAKLEADRMAAEKKAANESHRKKVRREAVEDVSSNSGIGFTDAADIVRAIEDGNIRHVRIEF